MTSGSPGPTPSGWACGGVTQHSCPEIVASEQDLYIALGVEGGGARGGRESRCRRGVVVYNCQRLVAEMTSDTLTVAHTSACPPASLRL